VKPRARIVALGQPAAGDDGVGFAVVEHLRQSPASENLELLGAAEDAALVDLLATEAPVILVDAVLGEPAGRVLVLSPDDLEARGPSPVSTHGLGAARVIALARALNPETTSPSIRIVAVTISRPPGYATQLSPVVAAAVPAAAARVQSLIEK
jgi:hydrogenase maturation protease